MRREKPKHAVFLLLAEIISSDRLPPVTLGIIVLNAITYLELFDLSFPSINNVCLSAISILQHKQFTRLILSPFFHLDDWHLYYNMTSFSIKGRSLEKRYGSGYFFFLIIVFSICCSLTLVALEYAAYMIFDKQAYLFNCAAGFSGVIFALKVLTTYNLPNGTVHMLNFIPVPSKYAYWVELITISLLVPNASFAG
jgi:rhomboid domain-containing protein 1